MQGVRADLLLSIFEHRSDRSPTLQLPRRQQKIGQKTSKALVTHTHTFNGPFSGTTQVSRYQKEKTNLDFTEARDSEWQWHPLGHMQVCTSLQSDNHASTLPLSFLQAGCLSCRPTNSVKALKAIKALKTKALVKQIYYLFLNDNSSALICTQ